MHMYMYICIGKISINHSKSVWENLVTHCRSLCTSVLNDKLFEHVGGECLAMSRLYILLNEDIDLKCWPQKLCDVHITI